MLSAIPDIRLFVLKGSGVAAEAMSRVAAVALRLRGLGGMEVETPGKDGDLKDEDDDDVFCGPPLERGRGITSHSGSKKARSKVVCIR
jgi:hypothetical protein